MPTKEYADGEGQKVVVTTPDPDAAKDTDIVQIARFEKRDSSTRWKEVESVALVWSTFKTIVREFPYGPTS